MSSPSISGLLLTCLKLSKADEAAVGRDDLEVRREDQDSINKFSRLHQREMALEDVLKIKAVSSVIPISMLTKLTAGTER